jgi:aminopeptidase N
MESNAAYYLAQNPGWAISNPAWATNPPANSTLFNYAITYMKASCILYMYRYVVGDSLFFHSIHEYANDTVNFRYKSATIPDFIEKMNEATGQELNWFFDQWLFQPNHPVYNNSYSFLELGDGKWNVYFKASQVQTNAPFFEMPLEILVNFKNGGDTLIRVTNDENDQVFVFQFDKEPVALTFDPGNNILLKQATTVVGIDPVIKPNTKDIRITPNPASTQAIVSFNIETKTPVKISLTDLSGKNMIDTGVRNYLPGYHSLPIDIRNYPAGAYLLTLQSGNQIFTKKLIVSGN